MNILDLSPEMICNICDHLSFNKMKTIQLTSKIMKYNSWYKFNKRALYDSYNPLKININKIHGIRNITNCGNVNMLPTSIRYLRFCHRYNQNIDSINKLTNLQSQRK
jgi:hypothetical protein